MYDLLLAPGIKRLKFLYNKSITLLMFTQKTTILLVNATHMEELVFYLFQYKNSLKYKLTASDAFQMFT